MILVLYALLAVIPYDARSFNAHLRWLLEPSFRAEVRQGKQPMPVLWAQMFKMKLGTGILVFCAVAVPWYLTLSLFEGVDDESKLFWYRFFIHDHFARLGAGVHTTTPGGTFIYFIEQGGFAIFPWVALVPGAFAVVSRLKLRSPDRAHHLALIATLWVAFSFTLLASSATKFHHYIFPVLPGMAVLIALFVDRLWEEGLSAHAVSLLFGLVLFLLVGKDLAGNPKNFTDLFVYNYDRPYPTELVTRPIAMFASRPLWMGDLLTLVLLAVGAYLAVGVFSVKSEGSVGARAVALLCLAVGGAFLLPMATRGGVAASWPLGVALGLVGGWVAWQATKARADSRLGLWVMAGALMVAGGGLLARGLRGTAESDSLLKSLSEPINVKMALGFFFAVAGVLAVVGALQRSRVMVFGTFWALAASFALWFNWGHWVDLSHHWTQRDLFWRYYAQRKPSEPITAFLMNWRGETFYSRNTVKQIREVNKLLPFVNQPGREWALVEHARLNLLRQTVGTDKVVTVIDRDINNKFVLVSID
jgi:4-amino-4-deoxy-L-arabinose transferase-like glycosyltransferase